MIGYPIMDHADYVNKKTSVKYLNGFVLVKEVLSLLFLGQWLRWMSYFVAKKQKTKKAILLCPWTLWVRTSDTSETTSLCPRMSEGSPGKTPRLGVTL